MITTKKNYRGTLIYPEKLSEKIADLFTRAETDFKEHKKFSRTFYVLSKDNEEIKKSFSNHTWDDLAAFKNMEMELLGNLCLFRSSRKPVSPNEAKNFCEIAAKLIHILA